VTGVFAALAMQNQAASKTTLDAAHVCDVAGAMSKEPAEPIAGDELPGAQEIVAAPDLVADDDQAIPARRRCRKHLARAGPDRHPDDRGLELLEHQRLEED
jgi:hypothetical protein